jgi:hypothetical protein
VKVLYSSDNLFAELKDIEITKERMAVLGLLQQSQVIGKYYSNRWVRTNVLKQTEEEIEGMTEEIQQEAADPLYAQPSEEDQQQPPTNQ